MMGHRHIATTERYLHYAPDADGAAKLTELWGNRGGRDRGAPERAGKCEPACAPPPDAPTNGLCRGAGQAAPLFLPRQASSWGELAFFGAFGSRERAQKDAKYTKNRTDPGWLSRSIHAC
jgi:hypothetical protein